MILKWIFDRVVSLIGLLFLWPVLLVIAILMCPCGSSEKLLALRKEYKRVNQYA
jgi:lipopolysaccharide/colanic/teichoic acid biosynthesis glycosyltransferase